MSEPKRTKAKSLFIKALFSIVVALIYASTVSLYNYCNGASLETKNVEMIIGVFVLATFNHEFDYLNINLVQRKLRQEVDFLDHRIKVIEDIFKKK